MTETWLPPEPITITVNTRLRVIKGCRQFNIRKSDKAIVHNIVELGPYHENHVRLLLFFTEGQQKYKYINFLAANPKKLLQESFRLHQAFPSKPDEQIEVMSEDYTATKKLYGVAASVKVEMAVIAESPDLAKDYFMSRFHREAKINSLQVRYKDLSVDRLDPSPMRS